MARKKALSDRIQSKVGRHLDVQLVPLANVSCSREMLHFATIAVSTAIGSQHRLERCEGQRVRTELAKRLHVE